MSTKTNESEVKPVSVNIARDIYNRLNLIFLKEELSETQYSDSGKFKAESTIKFLIDCYKGKNKKKNKS